MGPLQRLSALLAVLIAFLVARADCHASHSSSGSLRRGSGAAGVAGRRLLATPHANIQPADRSCGTSKAALATLAAAAPQLESSVYGRPTATMSAEALQQAVLRSAFPNAGVSIPVHFTIITYEGLPSVVDRASNVTTAAIAAQLAVLNADFAAAGMRFRLASERRWESLAWASSCDDMQQQISAAVVQDPASSLNVVLCSLFDGPSSTLGFAQAIPAPGFNETTQQQAIFIDFKTLPGGPYELFSGGRTLTHEVGHWLGLAHVFSNYQMCDGSSDDGVADTPRQATASMGCPVGKDSCPGYPGLDSVDNFMDYSSDSCMRRFTLGQAARMQAVVLRFRPRLLQAASIAGQGRPSPPPRQLLRPPPRRPPPPRRSLPGSSPPRRTAPRWQPRPRPRPPMRRQTASQQ